MPAIIRAATVNALVVAYSVIVPIDSSSFALMDMTQLFKTIAAISETEQFCCTKSAVLHCSQIRDTL
jgi:cellulose biosynthesis protein BcsQ